MLTVYKLYFSFKNYTLKEQKEYMIYKGKKINLS